MTVHVEQQSDRRFSDDIFKCISLSITICIVTEYWFNFVLKGPIVNIGVVSISQCNGLTPIAGDKQLPEPMLNKILIVF